MALPGSITANIQLGVSGRGEGQPLVPCSPALVSVPQTSGRMLAPGLSHCVSLSSWAALPTLRGLTNKRNFPLNDTVPSFLFRNAEGGPLLSLQMESGGTPNLSCGEQGYAGPPSDQGLLENTRHVSLNLTKWYSY